MLKYSNLVKVIVFVTIVIIGLNMKNILFIITGSETPIAVVRGSSMYPLLREGDIVFSYKPSQDQIRVGDIMIYESVTGKLVIHRVVDIKIIDNKYYYQTQGDNNQVRDFGEFAGPDRAGIPYERVKGIVFSINNCVFKIPYIGYLSIWKEYLESFLKK